MKTKITLGDQDSALVFHDDESRTAYALKSQNDREPAPLSLLSLARCAAFLNDPKLVKKIDKRIEQIQEETMIPVYILKGKTPVLSPDTTSWSAQIGTARSRVRVTRSDKTVVSTVFLGIDHAWGNGTEPLLFETMVFGGPQDGLQLRCATWNEAVAQHQKAVRLAGFPLWRCLLARWF